MPYTPKHGMRKTRIYSIWRNMKNRCRYPSNKSYPNYGGRGISYDPKWESFEGFYEDMGEGYGDDLSLERRDVDKNYCKENCEWIPASRQNDNKRKSVMVTYKGEEHRFIDLYRRLKPEASYKAIYKRIFSDGWTVERAFSESIDVTKRNTLYKGGTK